METKKAILSRINHKNSKYWYGGIITSAAKAANENLRFGLSTFFAQKSRCENQKHSGYQWWGANGIKQEYLLREYLGWVISERPKFKGKNPTVGRIDHSKNYSIDNIEIQSRSDNTKESVKRTKNPGGEVTKRSVLIIDAISGNILAVTSSITDASKITGVSIGNIWNLCSKKGRGKTGKGFRFEWL